MIVMISGGFDPFHTGHLNFLHGAAKYGSVTIALNSDDWLQRKKGYVFMPFADRRRILMEMLSVDDVTHVFDADDTVCEALVRIKPNYFLNGGDRVKAHPAEDKTCIDMRIEQFFFVGGNKTRSSSQLVGAVSNMKGAIY